MSDRPRRARLLRAAVGRSGPVEPTGATFAAWTELARTERVIPLLYEIVSSTTGWSTDQLEEMEAMQIDVAATSVRLEQSLVEVVDLFEAAHIDLAALKGEATAHLDYGDPSRRQFGDVDLLVTPRDMGRARVALEAAGWRQAYHLPRHHERFTHAVTFRGSSLAELDVHQHVAHRALGLLVPSEELMEGRVAFEIAGRCVHALGDADRLIHAALHLVSSRAGYRRLSSAADVLVLSDEMREHADSTLDRADRWHVRSLVEAAVRSAHGEAQLTVPEPWLQAMARPRHGRSWLVDVAYLGELRRPAVEELAHLWHMRGWRDRGLYLYGHLRMDEGPGSGGLRRRLRYLWSRLRQRTR